MVEKIEIIVEQLQNVGLNVEVFKDNIFKYAPALSIVSVEELIEGINYSFDNAIPIVTDRGTLNIPQLFTSIEMSMSKGMVA